MATRRSTRARKPVVVTPVTSEDDATTEDEEDAAADGESGSEDDDDNFSDDDEDDESSSRNKKKKTKKGAKPVRITTSLLLNKLKRRKNQQKQVQKPKKVATKARRDSADGDNNARPVPPRSSTAKTDFSNNATAFIASKSNSSPSSFWCRPHRVTLDPFESLVGVANNVFNQVEDCATEYLPSLKESVTFKTITELSPESSNNNSKNSKKSKTKFKDSEFKTQNWFEGKVIHEGNLVFNAGGPVLGLSWHPSGNLLAISTASHPSEDIDYKIKCEKRKSCIQIYRHYFKKGVGRANPKNELTPQLFICAEYGYATHVQWCNYYPDCWDTYDYDTSTFFSENKHERIGHLACSFEDGTTRIFFLTISDLFMIGTLLPDGSKTPLPIYKKEAEICLRLDSSVYSNTGQVCKFQWHEDNKFLAVSYYNGVVAIFDVQTTSTLLVETLTEDSQSTRTIYPFWCFQAHLGPINGLSFDPMAPRYFVTGSKDRNLKLWDMHLRQEIECRKIGLIHDICWIRGWINVAVSVDAAISNLSSQYNFVRFYQLGTSQPRPNCAEFMDVSSISFHEGLTLQSTESGNITCTYFDNFWRDLDFDRNKKKHNVVNICKIDLDNASFEELTNENFAGVHYPKAAFKFKDEAPRVILTFLKERVKTILPDPKPQFFENFIRFLPYLRINKISWCPSGECFVAGYRNGLVTILPATFSSLYG